MWIKFTELARRAILLAQQKATKHDSQTVGVAQIVAGVLCCEDKTMALDTSQTMTSEVQKAPANFVSQLLLLNEVDVSLLQRQLSALPFERSAKKTDKPHLTRDAKRVLELAADEARCLACSFIGPEFLLLGALRFSGPVSLVLADHNLSVVTVRLQLHALLCGRDTNDVGEVVLSDEVRELMTQSQQQASLSGNGFVGTGHFLLALILNGEARQSESIICVLQSAGVSLPDMRQKIKNRLTSDTKVGGARPAPTSEMRHVLENAKTLAVNANTRLVNQEHLLMALASPPNSSLWCKIAAQISGKPPDSVAYDVLYSCGVNAQTLSAQLWQHALQKTSQQAGNAL